MPLLHLTFMLIPNVYACRIAFAALGTVNPDRVILHSGCGYTGSNVALQPGGYDASDLNALGIGDNGLSSIIIPSGFQVQVFSEPGYRGDSLTFGSSVHCLGKNPHPWHYTWKDFISSLVISKGEIALRGSNLPRPSPPGRKADLRADGQIDDAASAGVAHMAAPWPVLQHYCDVYTPYNVSNSS
jgi:hypothetical protein